MRRAARLPSLSGLRSFVVAARRESFARAAEELHVTPGAVSRSVGQLEDELRTRLFERRGRGVALTPAGAAYRRSVEAAFEVIAEATELVRLPREDPILRINAPSTLSLRWLVPRLTDFQKSRPDLLVELTTKDGDVRYEEDGIDVAVVYGEAEAKTRARRREHLMDEEMGVFCAPAVQNRARVRSARDLLRHRLIENSTRPESWEEYLAAHAIPIDEIERPFIVFEHFFLAMEAAVEAMGFAVLPTRLVRREVALGRLVQPLRRTVTTKKAYYVERPRLRKTRNVGDFHRWIAEKAREDR